jgi:hypothetical protein
MISVLWKITPLPLFPPRDLPGYGPKDFRASADITDHIDAIRNELGEGQSLSILPFDDPGNWIS